MNYSKTSVRQLLGKHALLIALIMGLLVRLSILLLFSVQSFPDTSKYIAAGQSLFHTGVIKHHNMMPLYPVLSYLMGGGVFLKLLDILLSTATIWLIYSLSLELFDSKTGALIAALITALYPFFIFYSVSRLTESSYVFLLVVSFLLLHRQRYLVGSIFLVLSILLRPTFDLLAPLLVLCFSWVVHRSPWKQTLKRLAIYLAVYVVLMSPWWYHNYGKYGRFVRLNLGDGIVLYSGNNPMNRSGGGIGGVDVDLSLFNNIYDPFQRNAAMQQAAIRYIQQDPARFVRMGAVKFLRFWRLCPYADEYTDWRFVAASVLSYGPVLVLSIIFFLFFSRKVLRLTIPCILLIVYLTAVHMITISSIRYRLPIEPFLIIFAGYALLRSVQSLSKKTGSTSSIDASTQKQNARTTSP
jgi:4-amino-4-deoxy-L-arabinose transferase-like glycosyltransferase